VVDLFITFFQCAGIQDDDLPGSSGVMPGGKIPYSM